MTSDQTALPGCCRAWAKNPWNLAEALIVLGSLATVMTVKGETREVKLHLFLMFRSSHSNQCQGHHSSLLWGQCLFGLCSFLDVCHPQKLRLIWQHACDRWWGGPSNLPASCASSAMLPACRRWHPPSWRHCLPRCRRDTNPLIQIPCIGGSTASVVVTRGCQASDNSSSELGSCAHGALKRTMCRCLPRAGSLLSRYRESWAY